MHTLFEAVVDGARDPAIESVEVDVRPALAATALDVLGADAYVLGTPANLGYMSGALKHFFDLVYYPCLDATVGRYFGVYVHGNDDTTGAERGIDKIVTGLRWERVAETVRVLGTPATADREACRELGATVAARLALG